MKISEKWLFGAAAAALALSFAGCSDDDKKNDDGPASGVEDLSDACKGDECAAKQSDADTKMKSCDFAAAFKSINAVYLGQVASENVDPQTALDRSILGIIHLAYRDDVQKLLPKLGFTATGGVVDFKPLWDMSGGLFEQVFNATHEYGDITDKLPMRSIKEDVDYLDTIDKNLTFDDVLDVLVALKPDLESIAKSFAAAAATSSPLSPSSSIGCGLNKFQMDAADLNMMAAVFYAADAAIDLLAKYDFNFKIYDYYHTDDEIWDADSIEPNRCVVKFGSGGEVTTDTCADEYQISYKALECYEGVNGDDYNDKTIHQICFAPEDSSELALRKKMVELLNPHLFKKTSKSRKANGLDGLKAFQNVATHVLNIFSGNAKGKFFDFSGFPTSAVREIQDIASKVANVSVDMSQYIKPSFVIDLAKVFTNVLYRTEDLRVIPLEWPENVDFSGQDFVRYVIGDEVFFGKDLLNYITNDNSLVSSRIYDDYYSWNGMYYDHVCLELNVNDKYDAVFTSSWESFDLAKWLNPNDYLGVWEDDESSVIYEPDYPNY